MIEGIDVAVRSSLTALVESVSGNWAGRRERELVSLFCFGHLIRRCQPGSVLHDPAQIGIEIAVPQIPGQQSLTGKRLSKKQVCKDIVIWREPCQTCWDSSGKPTVRPISVIEWKHNEGPISQYDTEWLCGFSQKSEDFVGYAVRTDQGAGRKISLSCTRVFRGKQFDEWLNLS